MVLLLPMIWLAMGLTVPLTGTVVDAGGRPVAGATVWLADTEGDRQRPEVLATTQTDDRGRFWLERPDDLAVRGSHWSPTLWAYKPGLRVAFIVFRRRCQEPMSRSAWCSARRLPPRSASSSPTASPSRGARPIARDDPQGPTATGGDARPLRGNDRRRRPGHARRPRARRHLLARGDGPDQIVVQCPAGRPRYRNRSRSARSAGSRSGSSATNRRTSAAGRSPPGRYRPSRDTAVRSYPSCPEDDRQ